MTATKTLNWTNCDGRTTIEISGDAMKKPRTTKRIQSRMDVMKAGRSLFDRTNTAQRAKVMNEELALLSSTLTETQAAQLATLLKWADMGLAGIP